eukprot:COSAG05_NODE_1677_length_4292_cov_90.326735_5_plen_196_part_00
MGAEGKGVGSSKARHGPKPQPKATAKAAAQSHNKARRSPKPQPKTRRRAADTQTDRQTGGQAGVRQGVRQRGRAKGQGQEARPRGSAKKGKSFPGRKVVPASRSPDRAQKWGEGRRYSPRSGSNRSEAREPRRRLDGGPSSSSHFLKIASPAVVCGCYAVAAPAAMTADTRPVPGLGTQATRSPASGRATAIRWP